jgi:hypothetical protein
MKREGNINRERHSEADHSSCRRKFIFSIAEFRFLGHPLLGIRSRRIRRSLEALREEEGSTVQRNKAMVSSVLLPQFVRAGKNAQTDVGE